MCIKLPYCNPRHDKCLKDIIESLNNTKILKTLASCCGHNKYPTTIVVKDKTGKIFEYYSKIELGPRKRNRYYKKDNEGIYFIPEVLVEKHLPSLSKKSKEEIY